MKVCSLENQAGYKIPNFYPFNLSYISSASVIPELLYVLKQNGFMTSKVVYSLRCIRKRAGLRPHNIKMLSTKREGSKCIKKLCNAFNFNQDSSDTSITQKLPKIKTQIDSVCSVNRE